MGAPSDDPRPKGHGVHPDDPGVLYVLAAQGVQAVVGMDVAVLALYLPAGQRRQEAALLLGLYLPMSHIAHVTFPLASTTECMPGWQQLVRGAQLAMVMTTVPSPLHLESPCTFLRMELEKLEPPDPGLPAAPP